MKRDKFFNRVLAKKCKMNSIYGFLMKN